MLPPNRVPEDASPHIVNCELHKLDVRKRGGTEPYGTATAITGRIQRFTSFVRDDGIAKVLALTTTGMFSYENGTWTARFSTASGTADVVCNSTAFQYKAIMANYFNKLIEWDGYSASAVELTDSPVCRAVSNLGGRVLAGNIKQGAFVRVNRVAWSDFLLSNVWSGGTAGEADLLDTDDEILSMVRFRDQVVILRRKSIWTASVAEAPIYYRFERQHEGTGIYAPGTAVPTQVGVIFLGPDDLYIFTGSGVYPVLPKEFSLRRLIEERVSLDAMKKAVASAFPSRGQYWLALSSGDPAGENNLVVVVDYLNRVAFPFELKWSGLGVAEVEESPDTWSRFDVPWSSMDQPWSAYRAGVREAMLGANAGETQPLIYSKTLRDRVGAQDVAIPATWRTPLLNFAGGEVRGTDLKVVHRVQVLGESGSAPFKIRVGYSHDGNNITWGPLVTLNPTGPTWSGEWVYDPSFKTEAQWWTAEVQQDTLDQGFTLNSIIFWFTVTSPTRVNLDVYSRALRLESGRG